MSIPKLVTCTELYIVQWLQAVLICHCIFVSEIYRGCFDGWVGTTVMSNYEGCSIQYYMNTAVTWCFCSSPRCNQVSLAQLAGNQVSTAQLSGSDHTPQSDAQLSIHGGKEVARQDVQADVVHQPKINIDGYFREAGQILITKALSGDLYIEIQQWTISHYVWKSKVDLSVVFDVSVEFNLFWQSFIVSLETSKKNRSCPS